MLNAQQFLNQFSLEAPLDGLLLNDPFSHDQMLDYTFSKLYLHEP
jgi:hypothetical protein